MRLDQKYKSLLESYGINTSLRLAHFMAQIYFFIDIIFYLCKKIRYEKMF